MSEPADAVWDDPDKDYRRRYLLPEQFVWDVAAWPRIDFDGYVAIALDLLPTVPARVLDVGCGPGMGSARLRERGYEVTGVDYNERAIAYARILVPDGTFVAADIRQLPGPPTLAPSYDAALCMEVLEHVPPPFRERMLEGVAARLMAGGVLVLTTPGSRMRDNRWDYPRPDLHELRALIERTGFRVDEVRYQHRLVPWFRPSAWRFLSNRWYDLRAGRHLLRRLFLSRWNEADARDGGRFIVRAVRTS